MRLLVSIYNNGSDCTNHGITSNKTNAILIWNETDDEIIKNFPNHECVLKIVEGLGHQKYRIVPAIHTDKKWVMFGGNFAYRSDVRFPCDYPLPIHDRYEN